MLRRTLVASSTKRPPDKSQLRSLLGADMAWMGGIGCACPDRHRRLDCQSAAPSTSSVNPNILAEAKQLRPKTEEAAVEFVFKYGLALIAMGLLDSAKKLQSGRLMMMPVASKSKLPRPGSPV